MAAPPRASRHSPAAQALGCRIYTIFCVVYGTLMLASIAQLLPVTQLERAFFESGGERPREIANKAVARPVNFLRSNALHCAATACILIPAECSAVS